MLVIPLTTAILVVGVGEMTGVELDALLTTAAILEDDESWLTALLLA